MLFSKLIILAVSDLAKFILAQPTSRINVFEQIDVHDKIEDCIDEMIMDLQSLDGTNEVTLMITPIMMILITG